MTPFEIANRVNELCKEYKAILFKMRTSRLPLRPGNELEKRLEEIRREGWTYNVDIWKLVNC